jgi:hypothetical protein
VLMRGGTEMGIEEGEALPGGREELLKLAVGEAIDRQAPAVLGREA